MLSIEEVKQLHQVVESELTRLMAFVNMLQTDGMELLFCWYLKEEENFKDPLDLVDDILRNSIDAGFPKNMSLVRCFNEKDIEDLAHYAVTFFNAARIAKGLNGINPDLFALEAIPSDECLRALLKLLNQDKLSEVPAPRDATSSATAQRPTPAVLARVS